MNYTFNTLALAVMFTFFVCLQKHDIIKKRIDSHGNVIETRQEGIGAPKVSSKIVFEIYPLFMYL